MKGREGGGGSRKGGKEGRGEIGYLLDVIMDTPLVETCTVRISIVVWLAVIVLTVDH